MGLITIIGLQTTVQAAPTEKVLTIDKWKTHNNASVYYVNLPQLPIVDINVIFNAGSAQDGTQYGLANLTGDMIGESAKNLSADEIAEKFDDVAAVVDTDISRNNTIIHLRSLTDKNLLTPALETFTTIINQPNFNSASFNRVQQQTLQAILQQEQSPSDIADKALFKAIYQNYPYGYPRIGETTTVTKLQPKDLSNFYQRYYVGSNAKIIIVGDITKQRAKAIANQIVGNLPDGQPTIPLEKPKKNTTAITKHINYPASQTFIRLGELGINRHDDDYFPLYVGNYIFGGGVLVSRLFKEVRESRGLTYSVYSLFLPYQQPGPFMITLQARNNVADEAIDVIKKQLVLFLSNGPNASELNAAKQNIIGSFPLKLDSNSAILSQVSNIAVYNLPLDYLDTYREKVEQVTRNDVQRAFNKHIKMKNLLTITVGPESTGSQTNEQ